MYQVLLEIPLFPVNQYYIPSIIVTIVLPCIFLIVSFFLAPWSFLFSILVHDSNLREAYRTRNSDFVTVSFTLFSSCSTLERASRILGSFLVTYFIMSSASLFAASALVLIVVSALAPPGALVSFVMRPVLSCDMPSSASMDGVTEGAS